VLIIAAVGSQYGKIPLYKSSAMNVDHRTYDTGEAREKIIIKMINLDQYLGPKK